MKPILASVFVVKALLVRAALAADTLPVNIDQWPLPTPADMEVDLRADIQGEESRLPELLAERAKQGQEQASRQAALREWWNPSVSKPYWVVPSVVLPDETPTMAANNNVGIEMHEGRLYLAWRSAPKHFASGKTRLYIVSSADYGRSWQFETQIWLGTDMREPMLNSFKGRLIFSFFEAGTNPVAFQPKSLWHMERLGSGQWTQPEKYGDKGEIAWDIKARGDRLYATSYTGGHYSTGAAKIDIHFKVSDDGWNWRHYNEQKPNVLTGGSSEAGWEFDSKGNLWAVTRNEDGDATGFGAQVVYAPAEDLSQWNQLKRSDRKRYDSPRMFRHGEDIYMIARRDVGGPFDRGWNWMNFGLRKILYWVGYSLRAKRTALYWIDRTKRKVVWLQDLPGAGDTAFPSIVQTGPHSWLVANYTSPLRYPRRSWIWGQISPQGTQIYFTEISFEKK